jgi:C-methyltransferase
MEPHELIRTLINGGIPARCLQFVADLGVADQIDDEPVAAKVLAESAHVDAAALDRVLRLLAAYGVFDRRADGYRHTAASLLLRSDHPGSMRAFGQMNGLPIFVQGLADLPHSVRTGAPSVELTAPDGMWAYLQGKPDQLEVFARAMTAHTAADVPAILGAYDFSTSRRIADIGGGRGHLLAAILDTAKDATGVLFDLPDVVQAGGVAHPRLNRQAGDFFVDPLPAADTYLLMEILHDWADTDTLTILSAVARAAPPHSKVLVIENLLADNALDPHALTLDVVMLLSTGGRERTESELAALLRTAGLRLNRVINTGGTMRIAEAMPSGQP